MTSASLMLEDMFTRLVTLSLKQEYIPCMSSGVIMPFLVLLSESLLTNVSRIFIKESLLFIICRLIIRLSISSDHEMIPSIL